MTAAACAELVRQGDPERFLAVMAAPPSVRAGLFVLYAFNLEVARAPWVSAEPTVGAMRLTWWREVIDNAASGAARAHEVAGPLHALIRERRLDREVLDRMVAARWRDLDAEPFADAAALWGHLDDTAGSLMAAAGAVCGQADAALRVAGQGAGLAAWLRAAPALAARGHLPLPDDSDDALRRLAVEGLRRLEAARGLRSPALFSATGARAVLHRVAADPAAVREARLAPSPFALRLRLLAASLTGRW
jgi:phytoene/squalene synthetase